MPKAKTTKPKKPKVTDDAVFGACPTFHFLTPNDRIKKIGTTTWKFVPSKFFGIKAKYVAEEYQIQKYIPMESSG